MKSPFDSRLTIAAALATLLLHGCAEDAPEPAAAAAPDGAVEVGLVDFAFVGLPATIPAGTTLEVRNDAEEELHELVAFPLPDDEERTVEELTELSPAELEAALGHPVAVLLAEPGGPQIEAVGDGTLTDPGRYAVFCFIPTGVEPAVYLAAAAESDGAPQVDGGPPHFTAGMFAELVVE